MNYLDIQYRTIIRKLVLCGIKQENRTGVAAYKIPPTQIQFDMSSGEFPILTTKRVAFKTLSVELEGFIKGITSKKWFQDRKCRIWDEFSFTDEKARSHGDFSRKTYQLQSDDLGPIYGHQWRNFNGERVPTPEPSIPFYPMEESVDGKIYHSNNYGDFIRIGVDKIQFIHNGYKVSGKFSNFERGQVKNPYYPKYFGAGCIGKPNTTHPYYDKAKSVWNNMVSRCYNTEDKDYPRYGGKGVTISNTWLVFEYFLDDFIKIDGFMDFDKDPLNFTLDKDRKQSNKKYKQYSLEGCCFLGREDQAIYKSTTIIFDARGPNGEEFFDVTNLYQFCLLRGIDPGDANKRLNNKYPYKVNGWDFFNKRTKEHPWETCDQLYNIVSTLKSNPNDRRMICMAWNPLENDKMALPPCHFMFQLTTRGEYLDLTWTQRSVDVFLGLPFNISSYGLLLHLLCMETGFKPGYLTGNLTDVHLYENHVEAAREQLSRNSLPLPQIKTKNFTSIFDWEHSQTKLVGYECHPAIKAPVAV